MEKGIQTLSNGSILIIIINNEKKLNVLDHDMLIQLNEVITKFEKDDIKKAAVITGKGYKSFCAGSDLIKMNECTTEKRLDLLIDGWDVYNKISTISKPIIAAICGYALGGGFELALSCDSIVASSKSVFGLPEAHMGWIPGWGGTVKLAHTVGIYKAKEIVLLNKKIDAREALRLNIVSKILNTESLVLEEAIKVAETMGEMNRHSMYTIKKCLNKIVYDETEALLECHGVTSLMYTKNAEEKIDEFVERRE